MASASRTALLCLALLPAARPAAGEEAVPSAPPVSPEAAPDQEALAEPPPEDPAIEQARVHFDHGLRLVRREHWDAALAEFEASIAAHPNWPALYDSALCLRNLHQYARALSVLEDLLASRGGEMEERRRAEAQALLEEVRGLLTPLVVTVSVDGARVLLDDEPVGTSPLAGPLLVPSGPHRLEVRREGYMTELRRIVVVAGREDAEEVRLVERPRLGPIRVFANVPGAEVAIDGDEVGTVPFRSVLAEGLHRVLVSAEGYRPASRDVTVEASEDPIDVTLDLGRRVLLHRAWFWTTAGLATAATLAAVGLGSAVHLLGGRYDPDADDAIERWHEGRGLMIGTDVSLSLACAAAATSLVLAFFTDWR